MERGIRHVAVVGTGLIGASWAAFFLARGLKVTATDIAPEAREGLERAVDAAWPSLERLGLRPGADRANLTVAASLEDAVAEADLVQENGPERLDFKRDLYRRLDSILGPEVIIASSSSGLTMSSIQSACGRHPERCAIGHPFNPPHLIPLVEVVGGAGTSPATLERLGAFYRSLGKKTIHVKKEVPGHVANRLQAALFREVVHLIAEGVVSVADADMAVSWGPGLRWGIMGPCLLYHLGGGRGGLEQFFRQFAGPLEAWWDSLGSPRLTPAVQDAIVAGIGEELHARSPAEIAAYRDEVLIGLLALRGEEL